MLRKVKKCRVGITTRPEERQKEWMREHPNLHEWEWFGPYLTKTEAQVAEKMLAKAQGCEYGSGGLGDELATWHMYRFSYYE